MNKQKYIDTLVGGLLSEIQASSHIDIFENEPQVNLNGKEEYLALKALAKRYAKKEYGKELPF